MCLAVPGKIVRIAGGTATIDYGSEKREAALLEQRYAVGEYVLVQGGFVVESVPAEQAEESLKLYREALSESHTSRSTR